MNGNGQARAFRAGTATDILRSLQAKVGSADWNNWEIRRWQFWDGIRYAPAGVTSLDFFVVNQGGQDPVSGLAKTLEQTNMPKARSFGQVYYIIEQIRTWAQILPKGRQPSAISADVDLLATTLKDAMSKYNELLRRGVLKVQIGQKNYFDLEQPFKQAPPGFGLQIQQIGSSLVEDYNIFVQQSPHQGDVYKLTPPQMVEPEQTIQATIEFPTTSPVFTSLVNSADLAINTFVILDGYIARPAQ